jgi:uncharacterized protein YjbI with pentapeptide repeats
MKIQIKCRFTVNVLFEHECENNTIKMTLEEANSLKADLIGADLIGADLIGADLIRVNLSGVNLSGVNLIRADLIGADLIRANLSGIKDDFFQILASARNEIQFLRGALVNGLVDGSTYQGECACLVGTIANAKGVNYQEVGITPDPSRPAERWFLGIRKGDTPETNQISAITLGWVDEFLAKESV